MTAYRVVFEGPAALAVSVATALADADQVELISSEPPSVVDAATVRLGLRVEGPSEAVIDAVAGVRTGLPAGASIDLSDD